MLSDHCAKMDSLQRIMRLAREVAIAKTFSAEDLVILKRRNVCNPDMSIPPDSVSSQLSLPGIV